MLQPENPLNPQNRNGCRHRKKENSMNLLDIIAATEAKEKALQQVAEATDPTWATDITNIILNLATDTFTTDDIWQAATDANLTIPHEPRALGAIMHRLARRHIIVATDSYTPSLRSACHRRPIRVWKKP
jgi:hypothetical protein